MCWKANWGMKKRKHVMHELSLSQLILPMATLNGPMNQRYKQRMWKLLRNINSHKNNCCSLVCWQTCKFEGTSPFSCSMTNTFSSSRGHTHTHTLSHLYPHTLTSGFFPIRNWMLAAPAPFPSAKTRFRCVERLR